MPSRSATRAIWQAVPAGSALAISGSSGRATGRICSSIVASSLPAVTRRITVAVPAGSSPAMTAAALRIASSGPSVSCSRCSHGLMAESMTTADSGWSCVPRIAARAGAPSSCMIWAGSRPESATDCSWLLTSLRMPWARTAALRPAGSSSNATMIGLPGLAARPSRAACWLVRAVPQGASPAYRPGSARLTAMASNGPSTMIGIAPAARRVRACCHPNSSSPFR